jgi:hypothetical protein
VHVRVCRDCGEEYRPEIAVCADCGGVLEDRYEDEDAPRTRPAAPAPPEPTEEAVPSGFRPVFVTGHAAALIPLAERLRETEIEFHLHESRKDPRAPAASFSLLVHDENAARALRELAPLLAETEDPESLHAVESHFEGDAYRRCPACSSELPGGALECPECGLGLGDSGASCARCGSPLAPGETECAVCSGEHD